jgi:nucleotide-binding universal stress UspA family protein
VTSPDPHELVVGIDGTDDGLRALDWAAHISRQRGWPLRLVNAYQRYVPDLTSPAPDEMGDPARESLEVLANAMRHLEERRVAAAARTVSRRGSPVSALLDELSNGRMLVLGRRSGGGLTSLLLGSTSLACAVRASRPVAIVPPGYERDPVNGSVVLGIDEVEGEEAALELAFLEASARGAILDVVHARADSTSAPGELAEIAEVESAIEPWQVRHPEVEVRAKVENGDPHDVLIRHAQGAQLVVVGGHRRGRLISMLLGSTAREVIQDAGCPVVVAHDRDSSSGSDQMNSS